MVSHPNPWRQSSLHKPSFRGVVHLWGAGVSVVVGVVLVVSVPRGWASVVCAAFAASVTAMLTVSAWFHRRFWADEGWHRMRRLDQTMIYVLIAGTYTALVGLGLDGGRRVTLLTVAWVGAGLGIALLWSPIRAPTGLQTSLFIALGWIAVVPMPWFWHDVGRVETVLIAAGGLLYTVGAVLLGLRWPDVVTGHFGYHEVWHVLVAVAIGLHYAAVFRVAG